jgi:hypothetical protein
MSSGILKSWSHVTTCPIDAELADVDATIEYRFRHHRQAAVILSLLEFGTLLGAGLLAANNGARASFHRADRLDTVAGVAPRTAGLRPHRR